MRKLYEYQIEEMLSFLWENHKILKLHFKEPKTQIYNNYIIQKDGNQLVAISNWYRNYVSLETFELMINRMSELFLTIDFYKNNITLNKKPKDFSQEYKNWFQLE